MIFKESDQREPVLKAAKLYKEPLVVEVGVDRGDHAEFLHYKLKPSTLFLVDHWKDRLKDYIFVQGRFYNKNTILLRKESFEASKSFSDNYLDLVYIDADHTFLSVMKDLIFWYPKVKSGGMIAGHDYNKPSYADGTPCGVKRAVDLFFAEHYVSINVSKNRRDWYVIKL